VSERVPCENDHFHCERSHRMQQRHIGARLSFPLLSQVAQYSSAEAAALASKKKNLVGKRMHAVQ
jgi:hypothetical protein